MEEHPYLLVQHETNEISKEEENTHRLSTVDVNAELIKENAATPYAIDVISMGKKEFQQPPLLAESKPGPFFFKANKFIKEKSYSQ